MGFMGWVVIIVVLSAGPLAWLGRRREIRSDQRVHMEAARPVGPDGK